VADERLDLPMPTDLAARPALLVGELEHRVGTARAALWCADLLDGAAPPAYAAVLPYLGGRPAAGVLDGSWQNYWARVWGARGLRYVWVDAAAPAVVGGLDDEAWRVGEMCLKVTALREIGEAGPGAARWIAHELPRVRAAACRALGAVGDTEHVVLVADRLDDDASEVRAAAGRALGLLQRRLDLEQGPADRRVK
jgi:HEAT repeats